MEEVFLPKGECLDEGQTYVGEVDLGGGGLDDFDICDKNDDDMHESNKFETDDAGHVTVENGSQSLMLDSLVKEAMLTLKSIICDHIDNMTNNICASIGKTSAEHDRLVQENMELERRNEELKRENAKMANNDQQDQGDLVKVQSMPHVLTSVYKRKLDCSTLGEGTANRKIILIKRTRIQKSADSLGIFPDSHSGTPIETQRDQANEIKPDDNTQVSNNPKCTNQTSPSEGTDESCQTDSKQQNMSFCAKINWENNAKTLAILQKLGTPLIETRINPYGKPFSAFTVKAARMALEGTKQFSPGLTCADVTSMKQGRILFVKDVYDPTTRRFADMTSGFLLKKEDNPRSWHHNLLEFEKKDNAKYKFKTLSCRVKSLDRKLPAKLDAHVFFHDAKRQKPVVMDKSKLYIHVVNRHRLVCEANGIKMKEQVVVKVHHDKSLEWLENSAAYQFYIKVKDSTKYEAAPMEHMPHPDKHSSTCNQKDKQQ